MLNLVDKGCEINATDKNGKTALYHAVTASMEQFIRGLLSLGADPNITENQYNFTCLHMATCQGDLNCIHAILEYPGVILDAPDNINRSVDDILVCQFLLTYMRNLALSFYAYSFNEHI